MNFTLWACSLLVSWCGLTPSLATIQSAYEQEASADNKLHDKGLKVLNAKCHGSGEERVPDGQILCEVTFISTDDPNQRLYFDIVAVARTDDGWVLKSGLCKR
jgi:hypothetical protein